MNPAVLGIGTARPAGELTQAEAARMAGTLCCHRQRQRRTLEALFRRSGISTRASCLLPPGMGVAEDAWAGFYTPPAHPADRGPTTADRMAAFERHAAPLAVRAARAALAEAGVEAPMVTDLVLATCTGFVAPGIELAMIQGMGISPDVRRTLVGFMGCHAAINALRTAAAIVRGTPGACVLVCCVELCSLHFQYGWTADALVANALFADGAAAVVIGPGSAADWCVLGDASRIIAGTRDAMSWRVADHGFVMRLSPRVPELVSRDLRPWLDGWLGECGTAVERVGAWAIHAGGPRVVSAVAERLGLADEELAASRGVLQTCGNMSSATILFTLDALRRGGRASSCALLSFGPGLAAEAMLLGQRA